MKLWERAKNLFSDSHRITTITIMGRNRNALIRTLFYYKEHLLLCFVCTKLNITFKEVCKLKILQNASNPKGL